MVDSCARQSGGVPRIPALEYLKDLGVNVGTQLVMIVATHAHDDHFKGIADVFQEAASAHFVVSAATSGEEFWALLERDAVLESDYGVRKTAYREYRRIYGIVGERFGKPGYPVKPMTKAAQSMRLLHIAAEAGSLVQPVEVWSLAPSSEAIDRATRKFLDAVIDTKIKASTVDPNECSIALRVQIGDTSILLGGDLTNGPDGCGWEAVLATADPFRASLFKVPHHGSDTSQHLEVWERLLEAQPVAVVAPYRGGTKPIPAPADRSWLRERTKLAYLTARAEFPPMRASVKKTREALMSLAKDVRDPWGEIGRVTARRRADAVEWTVTTEWPAHALGDGM